MSVDPSAASQRQMALVAFMQAQNCSNFPLSWRHEATAPDFTTAEYYQRIARVLEDGRFDLAFFDDRLAMPDVYGHDHAEAVRHGIRVVKMDPIPLMLAMALATRYLGVAGTCSTTYFEPFHVARTFATLDHMTGGRVGWNVVTSMNDSEAANFGKGAHMEHDSRYDRADEFMQAVLGHWDSWEDDAIVLDKERGVFADPAKVHRLDHEGRWFRTRGPFPVPRTPQGRPVIVQAGSSPRGRRFAGRWAELIFAGSPSLSLARERRSDLRAHIARAGRDPDRVRILPAISCIVGETKTVAEEKAAYIERLAHPLDTLVLLGEALNFDFGKRGMDEPLSDEDMASISGAQSMRDRVVQRSGKQNPTPRDFVTYTQRGTVHSQPLFIGTAKEVADGLEEWFTSEACDGFILSATHLPGAYEDFVRLVVPELQRRGLVRRGYTGVTLRDHLGLPRAQRGDWRLD